MASVDGFDWTYEDEGPEYSDCATAAHLRDCGFCRAVLLDKRVERMWLTMQNLMDSEVFIGSEPRRIFYALPKNPTLPFKSKWRWWR